MHACEGQLVYKQLAAVQVRHKQTKTHAVDPFSQNFCHAHEKKKVPKFNSPVYLENKTKLGKVDEIFGPVNEIFFSVVLDEGFQASSFKAGDQAYMSDDRLLPARMFL